MSVLTRKARRDLFRQRWQYLSIALTIAIGVMLFAASYDAFLNLQTSYNRTYERLAFADLTVSGGDSARFAQAGELARRRVCGQHATPGGHPRSDWRRAQAPWADRGAAQPWAAGGQPGRPDSRLMARASGGSERPG